MCYPTFGAKKERRAEGGAPVIFQEVVHSIGTGEAGCDEQSIISGDRMDYHKNAPWTAVSRERLARIVVMEGVSVASAAARFSVSAKTAAKWVGRYRQLGAAGMADRSSRPHRSPRQTCSSLVEKVVALRRLSYSGWRIGRELGSESGHRQPHPAPRPAEPVAGSESAAAGAAIRTRGARRSAPSGRQGNDALRRGLCARRWPPARQKGTSRLPGSARGRRRSLPYGLHPDAARSEDRNHHRLPAPGRRVLRPTRHRRARLADRQRQQLPITPVPTGLPELAIKHRRTRPYTPRTNGKAERFIQTALREWAYAKHWTNSRERDSHLEPWNHYYNCERPHGSLNYKPPISRSELRNNLLIFYRHPELFLMRDA